MPDPFLDVDSAGAELVGIIAQSLENRGADPQMTAIIDAYLIEIDPAARRVVEIGSGTGAISRRIATRFPEARVTGIEPSTALVADARTRGNLPNLDFAVAPGEATGLADRSADIVVFHTVLSHVREPTRLLGEAHRILRPGGRLIVCDADFSKLALGLSDGDPLEACARTFLREYVVDPYLCAKLRPLVTAAGFRTTAFTVRNRLDLGESETGGGLAWVLMSTKHLIANGTIGEELAGALLAEYKRRVASGTVYGFNPIATLIALRPEGDPKPG